MQGLEQFKLDDLVQPIPGDSPAGVKLSAADREKLDSMRREHNPEDYEPSDPLHHEPRQVPNWASVVRDAERLLKTTSKDLNLAARLTEAWTRQHDVPGVLAGLTLLRRLCDEAWSRVHPNPEPSDADDVEMKLRDFRWLDDPESAGLKGARYPSTVRGVVLTRLGDVVISASTCRPVGTQPPTVSPEQLRAAASGMPAGEAGQTRQAVQECLEELEKLLTILNDNVKADLVRLGVPEGEAQARANEYLPGFTETRKALEDCKLVAEQLVMHANGGSLKTTGDSDQELQEGENDVVDVVSRRVPGNGMNRNTLYDQLRRTAEVLQRVEPHSPVPFLILRAVELRDLHFPELVEVLTREARVLDFMRKKIESTASSSSEESS